jgi:hypothetical protein
MNKNAIFRSFIENEDLQQKNKLRKDKLDDLNLNDLIQDPLINTIKQTIRHMDDDYTTDKLSRKLNQLFNQLAFKIFSVILEHTKTINSSLKKA